MHIKVLFKKYFIVRLTGFKSLHIFNNFKHSYSFVHCGVGNLEIDLDLVLGLGFPKILV